MKKTKRLIITAILIAAMTMALSVNAFAVTGEAVVNSYMLNVREGAGMEYTIIDVAYEGNTILVTQDNGNGWVQVSFNGQTGYVNAAFLTFRQPVATQTYTAPADTEVEAGEISDDTVTTPNANAVIHGEGVYMRSGPSLTSEILDVLYTNDPVRVNGATGAWYEVVHGRKTGYVYGDYVVRNGQSVTYTVTAATVEETTPVLPEPIVEETVTPAPQTTPAPQETPKPAETAPAAASSVSGQAIVDTAMKYIGVRYVWAGTSPETGFDCSGLVYYVYGQHGITLNRVAQSMYYNGKAADLNNLQPGDILLFGSSVYNIWHAGIYVGNGMFIHSPHSGATVRTQPLSELYGYRLVATRRIV